MQSLCAFSAEAADPVVRALMTCRPASWYARHTKLNSSAVLICAYEAMLLKIRLVCRTWQQYVYAELHEGVLGLVQLQRKDCCPRDREGFLRLLLSCVAIIKPVQTVLPLWMANAYSRQKWREPHG